MIEVDRTQTAPTLAEVFDTIDDHDLSPGAIPSGFAALDQVLNGGFHPGDVTLIGGGPGVGKTIATLQMARSMALEGREVAYVCYEHGDRALLARLLLLELGEMEVPQSAVIEATDAIWRVAHGEAQWSVVASRHLVLRAAQSKVGRYADLLTVVEGSATLGLPELVELTDRVAPSVLFVDYLQKIPIPNLSGDNRVTAAVEGLKDLALATGTAVVAVVAGTKAGLQQRRLRLHHLRGAEALAYEADVVVLLNDKAAAVSRRHSAFDGVKSLEFGRWVVFSVEKNRHGPAGLNVEFMKDFATYRFVADGRFVEERLVDGTSQTD